MQGSADRVVQMLSTAAGQEAFLSWLSSPLTQELLGAAEESVAPADTVSITAENALFQLGIAVGGRRVLERIRNPLYLSQLKDSVRKLDDVPRYGADKIMKEERM